MTLAKNVREELSGPEIVEGKIIDFIDGKARPDNEVEQIRQNFERTLIEEYQFAKGDIGVDIRIKVPDGSKTITRKLSLAVFRDGVEEQTQDNISILIQIAKPAVQPTDTKNGATELERALIACRHAAFACWTNGIETIYFQKKKGKFDTDVLPVNDFPRKGEDASSIFTTDRSRLRVATGNNLLNAFTRCHDFIHANQGGSKEQIFWEFLKILFAKIEDEQNEGRPRFAIRNSDERNTKPGQKEVKDRVELLFRDVCQKKEFRPLFSDTTQDVLFNADVVTFIVAQLEKYDFIHSSVDVKGVAYEAIVGPTLEGTRGEFFTPRNVVKLVVKMLDPKPGQRILDPACGTGGFIVVGFNYVSEKLRQKARKSWKSSDKPTSQEEKLLFAELHEASKFIFGTDFNSNLVKTAQMNMVMNNDGRGGLFPLNSLWKPSQWPSKDARELIELGSLDFVMANPPFGTKIKVEGQDVLEQYDLAHAWTKQGSKWVMEGALRTAMPPEVLFIERCVQFLKPGTGKLGIVVPDGILGNPDYEYIRYWILANCQVLASVDLPVETFMPRTGTQTSVLILRRKSEQEKLAQSLSNQNRDYEIFMAIAKVVGKDRRGKIIYRRDKQGREVVNRDLYPHFRDSTVLDFLPAVEPSGRVVDDDLPTIAQLYLEAGDAHK
jgi:type I restriction enzyme M protein